MALQLYIYALPRSASQLGQPVYPGDVYTGGRGNGYVSDVADNCSCLWGEAHIDANGNCTCGSAVTPPIDPNDPPVYYPHDGVIDITPPIYISPGVRSTGGIKPVRGIDMMPIRPRGGVRYPPPRQLPATEIKTLPAATTPAATTPAATTPAAAAADDEGIVAKLGLPDTVLGIETGYVLAGAAAVAALVVLSQFSTGAPIK